MVISMEIWNRQKRILFSFCVFLAFMFACTLISRAVYASKLPQVSVESPRRIAISHRVETEGIVRQGREYAVNALAGLRVRTVYAHVGDRVTANTVLFDIDMEDLKRQIQEKELAVKKLQIGIADGEKNQAKRQEKMLTDQVRVNEDYVRAWQEAQNNWNKAEWQRQVAQRNLDDFLNHPVSMTSEADRKAAKEKYEAWVKEGERLKEISVQAKADWDAAGRKAASENTTVSGNAADSGSAGEVEIAKDRYERMRAAYDAHMGTPVMKPDYSAEDAALYAWEKEKIALEDTLYMAVWSRNDMEAAKEKALAEAKRSLEDAAAFGDADSSLELSRLELTALLSELAVYREAYRAQGKFYPGVDGIVTGVRISPGERVPDGAAVICADLSAPLQFTVSLSKEQKRYVNQGDVATLLLGSGKGEEYRVDYIAQSEANPELYEARIPLRDGIGTIGQSGTFAVDAQSETYSCCIPIAALREDAGRRKFVYIVNERSGILGKELAAEAVYVKVLDQNDTYAAIEGGVIDSGTELIVASTEPIEDRAVIRYRE